MRSALLLSGGMDSISLAYLERPAVAITVDYGQIPADAEIRAAGAAAQDLGIGHDVVRIDCSSLGSGDLAGRNPLKVAPVSDWWPYRNQLLITIGAARALALGLDTVLIGIVRSDDVHGDGRALFVERMSTLLACQEGQVRLLAPARTMSTVELIRSAKVPMETLAWAHSCHAANLACGRCRGCAKHFAVTTELGLAPY